MKLTFLGAAQTVTGSRFLLETNGQKILVDCGLFQGLKKLRELNWRALPVVPASIDAVILTHAHIDHSGYLPLLVKNGFKGKVFCTTASAELCAILLPDSGYLHEEDAARANRYGYTRHRPALPLYTQQDAVKSLQQFVPLDFNKLHALKQGIKFEFTPAGHILGAACVHIYANNWHLVFSGDLGRPNDPVVQPPARVANADYLILESTYGNRRHAQDDPLDILEAVIRKTVARSGKLLIPAFAVGRAQSLLYYINQLKRQQRIPNLLVYLDSPMAISVTELLQRHCDRQHLSMDDCKAITDGVIYTRKSEDSKAIYLKHLQNNQPVIIISASGMLTGGRVLHHLKNYIIDPRNTILLVGFQAPGTRGSRLLNGETDIKIHGKLYPVNAEIVAMDNMSAHADYLEIVDWLEQFQRPPIKTFLVHGEYEAISSLKFKIEEKLQWDAIIPNYMEVIELD